MCERKIEWYKTLEKFKYKMIFGATNKARKTCFYVKDAGFDIECYIVSKRGSNPFYIDGKPVKTFDEISENIKKNGLVIISQIYENNEAMESVLLKAGFKNMISSATQLTLNLTDEVYGYCKSVLGEMKKIDTYLQNNDQYNNHNRNICIYAVTSINNLHSSDNFYRSNFIQYIQAGAKLSDKKICAITDDSGDNISELNPYFSELTAGYWIYKNDSTNDYVGLYHYSRGLDISDDQIKGIVQSSIDVVLPFPAVTRQEIITKGMRRWAQLIFKALNTVCSEYVETAEKYFYNKVFLTGNLIFAKKKVYCKYYEWLFNVINECIKIHDKEPVGDRMWAYFGEHLMNIYFLHNIHKYTVAYAEIKNMSQ